MGMQSGIITAMNLPQRRFTSQSLVWLCILLWLGGLYFSGTGIDLLLRGATWPGLVVLAVGGLMAACGAGLWRLRRWGVFLFGVLSILGSINFLSNILLRYGDLSQANLGQVFAAWFNLLAAVLIPVVLFYLTLLLWRRTR